MREIIIFDLETNGIRNCSVLSISAIKLEIDEKGRKLSNKKKDKHGNKKICGRPNKVENLTKKQKDVINRWISKAIKTDECILLSGLGRSTLFRIKKQMLENN